MIISERLEEYLLSSSGDSLPENLFHFEPILEIPEREII